MMMTAEGHHAVNVAADLRSKPAVTHPADLRSKPAVTHPVDLRSKPAVTHPVDAGAETRAETRTPNGTPVSERDPAGIPTKAGADALGEPLKRTPLPVPDDSDRSENTGRLPLPISRRNRNV